MGVLGGRAIGFSGELAVPIGLICEQLGKPCEWGFVVVWSSCAPMPCRIYRVPLYWTRIRIDDFSTKMG